VASTIRREAEKEMKELCKKPNNVFKFSKLLKREGKDVEGGRYIRGKYDKLGFNENARRKVWKEHMEQIKNEENEWDHATEADMIEGPVERIIHDEIVKAIGNMKTRKASGQS